MNNKNELKAGIVLNYINQILGNLIPLFYTPIMLSLLGKSEYGLYKLSSSVTSYLGLISIGIGSAMSRYLIKTSTEKGKDAEEKMLGLFLVIFRVIALVVCLVGSILAFNLSLFYGASLSADELIRMKKLVLLMTCNTALSFSLSPYISIATTHERFIFIQLMSILSTCVAPIVNLIVLFLGYSSIGMAVTSLSLGVLTRGIYYIFVRNTLKIKAQYKEMPTHQIKEILGFSFWIFIANIVGQLYNATDTVMIGAIPALATVSVAVYNVGALFNKIVFDFTTGLSSLISPRTSKMVFSGATETELTELAIRIGRIQALIIGLVASGFIAFGRPFLDLYVGESYRDSYWVAVVMIVPYIIPAVQSVCLSITVSKNKHQFRSIVYLIIALLNVAGTWFLLHTALGIIGAALMTGIGVFLGHGVAMNWYYQKKVGLRIVLFWKKVGVTLVIPVLMCIVCLLIGLVIDFHPIFTLLTAIIVYTIIYCLGCWYLIMNHYEKELVTKTIKSVLNKIKKTK